MCAASASQKRVLESARNHTALVFAEWYAGLALAGRNVDAAHRNSMLGAADREQPPALPCRRRRGYEVVAALDDDRKGLLASPRAPAFGIYKECCGSSGNGPIHLLRSLRAIVPILPPHAARVWSPGRRPHWPWFR